MARARVFTVRLALGAALALAAACGGGGGDGDAQPVAVRCPTRTPESDPPGPGDPLYGDQWHLNNTGQAGGTPGEDVKVESVWADGRRGESVCVAVVDDGLEIAHEDLAANVAAGLSFNYLNGGGNPTSGRHGTAAAGVVAARDLNDLGVRGAAPRAYLLGYNLLQNPTASNEADAMVRNAAAVYVSNNSWGPMDGDGTLASSSLTWRNAIATGLATGRGGLGTVYVWAAGNGGDAAFNGGPLDNSNYDGYANNRGVIAVCAVGDNGVRAFYSERGANLWVCAPSMGDNLHGLTTTDRQGLLGYSTTNYTSTFNGTSGATPVVSGVVALMLQANPGLGWRDVRLILAETARRNDPTDPDWTANGAGYLVNHNYGFGVVDAQAAVARALTWTTVGPQASPFTVAGAPGLPIPDNDATGVAHPVTVAASGITQIEYVEVTFSASDHTYSGDLEITLTSPAGTVSRLAEPHACGTACTPYNAWVFGSARHLGEAADGGWTLTVKDLVALDTGTFQSWQLKLYGR